MMALIESLVVVALGLLAVAFFIWTMMSGAGAIEPWHAFAALGAYLLVWIYGLQRTY